MDGGLVCQYKALFQLLSLPFATPTAESLYGQVYHMGIASPFEGWYPLIQDSINI